VEGAHDESGDEEDGDEVEEAVDETEGAVLEWRLGVAVVYGISVTR